MATKETTGAVLGRLDALLVGAVPVLVRLAVCNKNKKRRPCAPVNHDPVCCPTCGKEFKRCDAHDGASGARRSLGSHKAFGMCCPTPAATPEKGGGGR